MLLSSSPIRYGIAGLAIREHEFAVPLDHAQPDGETIRVFAREVVDRQVEAENLPWLVFFQGGPGFAAPRPSPRIGWMNRVLEEYRLLLLDQRGTGRSTPIGSHTLEQFPTPYQQAEYLRHFRADSIIRDAELIRCQLLGPERKWTGLGQSFGGWCLTTYLSLAPEGLEAALFTGGIPPIHQTAEEVYRATYQIVEKKNHRYYERFPEDEPLIREIVDQLLSRNVLLPGGDRLTARRFQQLGLLLYRSTGSEALHELFEGAFVQTQSGRRFGDAFLYAVEAATPLPAHPLFSVLHEAIYAAGPPTRWAAERVGREFPQFDASGPGRVLLTGEMINPWMFEDYRGLRPFSEVAHLLAEDDRWSPLYDLERLRHNRVPCAAIVYYEDMCVVREFSEQAAQGIGNMKIWVTNEYEHDGLRADGERIVDRLLEMVQGGIWFSF